MTKEEAMRRRKKRKMKKRILLIITAIAVGIIIFFGVKAVSKIINKNFQKPADSTISSQGASSEAVSSADESSAPQSTEAPSVQPTPPVDTPAAAKPEASWSTTLVNKDNPLPADFTVEVRNVLGSDRKFDSRAADSLEAMLNDAAKAGYKMYLVSTYRTVAYQQGLYNRKVNEYKNKGYDEETAKAEAGKWVAIPGTSEHNLGLAADIVSSTWYNKNQDLTQEFENTEHFKWLSENCAKYGFILRYPKDKESVTGIAYEPWHYRYVGVDAANYITANGICLEEFHK